MKLLRWFDARLFQKLLLLSLLLTAFYSISQAQSPILDGCEMFPANNPWNTDISNAPVHPLSDVYIANINANGGPQHLQAGFGSDPAWSLPWISVDASQPKVDVVFLYTSESEPGPYPIPDDIPIEPGEDHHALILETTNCILYELYQLSYNEAEDQWYADSGAIFDLSSNALRPDRWTSADAAGLPMLPGMARCEEAMTGVINHAFRVAVNQTQRAYTYPATHYSSEITDPAYPPMGTRLRLKADYDLSGLSGQALAIATALKKYGMMIGDNGVNWIITGETNSDCWSDAELNQLKGIPGTAFEVVISPPPPVEDGNLLANGGFEGADRTSQALAWDIKNGSGEKRICDGVSTINGVYKKVSIEGYCAYKFKGVGGESSKLKQKVGLSGYSTGQTFALEASAYGSNLPDGSLRLIAKLKHAEGTKDKWVLPLGGGTFENTPFVQTVVSTGTAAQLTAIIDFSSTSGKGVVDVVRFAANPIEDASVLPLP